MIFLCRDLSNCFRNDVSVVKKANLILYITNIERFCSKWIALCPVSNGVFFLHSISKNAILCLILQNASPSKMVVCFILNNLHFPMVEGIAFYTLYKLRLLIIPCKAYDFRLFIGLPDENLKKVSCYRYIFSLYCGVTLRKHYIIKATWSVI